VIGFESFGPAPRMMPEGDSLRLEGIDSPAARQAFLATNIPAPAWVHAHSLLYYLLNTRVYQRLFADRIEEFRSARVRSLSRETLVDLYRRVVLRMNDICRAHRIPLLVTFGYEQKELESPTSPYGPTLDWLSSRGVATVDLFDSLRVSEAEGPTLYYRYDIHWNARGHQRVAALLAPVVQRMLDSSLASSPASSRASAPSASLKPPRE
jgi:hypothetical protein